MNKILRVLALVVYYTVAIHFPTAPAPTFRIGYWLRRLLLKAIADSCGDDVVVKRRK